MTFQGFDHLSKDVVATVLSFLKVRLVASRTELSHLMYAFAHIQPADVAKLAQTSKHCNELVLKKCRYFEEYCERMVSCGVCSSSLCLSISDCGVDRFQGWVRASRSTIKCPSATPT